MAYDSTLGINITLTGAEQAAKGTETLSAGFRKVKVSAQEAADAARKQEVSYADFWKKSLDAQDRAAASAEKAAQKKSRLNEELNKSQTATGNSAMGLLFLSQAIEDVQYGFGAVLNNIPLIIMSMGGSAGLAGAASIAGVAVYQVAKNTDLFGAAAKNAASAASANVEQLIRMAEKSEKVQAATQKEAEALKEIENSLKNINKAYEENISLAQRTANAKISAADREAGIYNAQFEDELASVELRRERGDITQAEANKEITALRLRAVEFKKANEEAKAQAKAEEELAKIKEAQAKAQQLFAQASELEVKSAGLLTPEERAALKKRQQIAFEEAAKLQAEKEALIPSSAMGKAGQALGKTLDAGTLAIMSTLGVGYQGPSMSDLAKSEADYAQQRAAFINEETRRQQEIAKVAAQRLEDDKAAQQRLGGIGNRKDVSAQVEAAKKELEASNQALLQAQEALQRVNDEIAAQRQILTTQGSSISKRGQIEALQIQRQQQEDERRRQDDEARAAEQRQRLGTDVLQLARRVSETDGSGRIVAGEKPKEAKYNAELQNFAADVARLGADGYTDAEIANLRRDVIAKMQRLVNANHESKKFMEDLAEKLDQITATQKNDRR